MHIGLIGGIGPAATTYYYERIVAAFAAKAKPLHLTIAHTSALNLSQNVAAGHACKQASEYKRVTDQLTAAGATTVVITSMGGHFCFKEFSILSPIPIINGPDAVSQYLSHIGVRRIGILGTQIVMQSQLYGSLSTVDAISPRGDALIQVNDDYVAMAIAGKATHGQRQRLLQAGQDLIRNDGAEALLLGGTDLNLVFGKATVDYPVIDSAQVHVDAIVTSALS